MADVSFEEETYQTPNIPSKGTGGFAAALVRFGLAKNEKEASVLLVWVAGMCCVLALGLVIGTVMNQPQGLDESDIERIIQLQQQ